jgi:hypothetical protein
VASVKWDRFAGVMGEWIRDTGHAMRSDEEALTWAFGMLVARCEAARTGGEFPPWRDPDGYLGAGRHLCRLLDQMRWAAERSTPVRESLDRLQSLVATADMDWRLGDVSDPLETGLALALGFESLLAGWNRSLRRRLGVYFTPRPLVQYILRGVDKLLREELSVGDGLATTDTPLTIIDPACGSGVFLLGVAEHVR